MPLVPLPLSFCMQPTDEAEEVENLLAETLSNFSWRQVHQAGGTTEEIARQTKGVQC